MSSSQIKEETGILNSNDIKDKIKAVLDNIMKKFFAENNTFENQTKENVKENANQALIDHLCNEVIEEVYSQFNGFKLVCTGHLLGEGNAPFLFDSNCLWDRKTDYYVESIYHKEKEFYAYICLFIIAP